MIRKDWLLMVIAAAKGDLLSPVQIQKSMFLLGEEHKNVVGDDFYRFVPYAYGPFCAALYHDAEELEREGFVSIHLHLSGRWREYRITTEGEKEADKIRVQTSEQTLDFISETVKWIRQLSFHELVKKIYEEYPQFREHSVFWNK